MTATPRPVANTFLDSTVLFSAAYSAHGQARDLLLAGLRGELRLALSDLVLLETERNLSAKAPRAVEFFRALQPILLPLVVNPSPRAIRRAERSIDPKDAPIVAGALAAHARYLATYDRRHLLNHADAIRAAIDLRVMTPDDVLAAILG